MTLPSNHKLWYIFLKTLLSQNCGKKIRSTTQYCDQILFVPHSSNFELFSDLPSKVITNQIKKTHPIWYFNISSLLPVCARGTITVSMQCEDLVYQACHTPFWLSVSRSGFTITICIIHPFISSPSPCIIHPFISSPSPCIIHPFISSPSPCIIHLWYHIHHFFWRYMRMGS